jgi:thiopurine S-methyltransferase
MDAEFWRERWQLGEIGFHKSRANPLLMRWWPALALNPGAKVLVPLCGKSLDMLWLREQGSAVVGAELSRQALDSFIEENELSCKWQDSDGFDVAACTELTLYCGDFFALEAAHLATVSAVYDRAALIALPPPMRQQYVAHLREQLQAGWKMLLITLDYRQSERPGPPFSVPDTEVRTLFSGCSVSVLQEAQVLEEHAVFRDQGMTSLIERVYLIEDK